MANVIKNGISISPSSGSGNTEITIAAEVPNLGNRVAINAKFRFTTSGSASKERTYVHDPAEEFVSFNDGGETAIGKDGGELTINGKTNASKLTFSLGTGDIEVSLPDSYMANSSSTNNGTEISGDPGATHAFAFSITLSIPENTTISELTKILTVNTTNSKTASITIKQTAGDSSINVTGSLNVPQSGSITNSVVTNDSWSVIGID